jgi:hypothetical protein
MNPSKAARLAEYGMYIKRTADGTYNLGWTHSQKRGGIANYPTYAEAYEAFEDIIETYWDHNVDDFQYFVETRLRRH